MAARIGRLVAAYVGAGADTGDARQRRGHEIVNFVSLATVVSNTGFALMFLALGPRTYAPLIVALLVFSAVWALTPLLHRFGTLAAGTYLWATAMAGDAIYAIVAGKASGLHYFLLAGPATIVMVLGSRRVLLVGFYFAMMLLVFCGVELFVPPKSPFMALPDAMARTIFLASVCISAVFNLLAALYTFRRAEDYQDAFEAEHARSEKLLLNLMPAPIAARMKQGEVIADSHAEVTILFADIVGFTGRAARMPAPRLVAFLNRIFLEFDRLAERHGLEKIKTIGDAYMVAGGLPDPKPGQAALVADMALEMIAVTQRLSRDFGEEVSVRIGIHSGPAVAGVIGERKQFYDVWGDTVNVAARMEQHGEPGMIQVTREAVQAIGGGHRFTPRGLLDVKGKGPMEVFALAGRAATAAAPGAAAPGAGAPAAA
ncbi:MAG: adenylate/guanylate cyclase domain-containing protein [Rhizobiaceae bacterium]|nr:adenylate/guanylate cyclase domain-containing protein [Rhizobiaceae bacterium]